MFELTESEYEECEQSEREKHDEKVKELEEQAKLINACYFGVVPTEQRVSVKEI